jgi:drug/metabolite transporter (DMT)-like permease
MPHVGRGVAYALGSAVLWGGTVPFAKRVLDTGVPPLQVAGLLYLGAALGLACFPRPAERRTRRDYGYLLAGAFVGGMLAPSLAMIGQERSSGMAAALLFTLELPATAIIAVLIFRERLSGWLAAGGLLVLSGAVVLGAGAASGDATGATLGGALAMVGSCISWGIDNNVTTRVAHLDPLRVARFKGAVAAPLTLAIGCAVTDPRDAGWTAGTLAQALAIGLVGYGFGLSLIVRAFRELGAARTGAYFATAPFVGAIATIPVLGERPTTTLALAGLLMAAGVFQLTRERRQ